MKDYSNPPEGFDLDNEMSKWGITDYTHEKVEFKFGVVETMLRLTGSNDSNTWTPENVTMEKFLKEFAYDDLRELMTDTIGDRLNYFNRLVAMKEWNDRKESDEANR